MRQFIRWLWVPVFAMLAAGCASTSSTIPSDYKVQKNSKRGLVVFTTSMAGSSLETTPYLHLRGLTGSYSRTFPLWDGRLLESGKPAAPAGATHYTVPEDQPMGMLYVLELPEGTYEFFDLGGKSATGYIKSTSRFSQQFTVRGGTVLYVGNYHIDHHPYDALARAMMSIRNLQERDLLLLQKQFRNLTPDLVQIGIAKEAAVTAQKP